MVEPNQSSGLRPLTLARAVPTVLKRRRKQQGLSLKAMAVRMGVARGSVCQVEHAKHLLGSHIGVIAAYCEGLGCSVGDVIREAEIMSTQPRP